MRLASRRGGGTSLYIKIPLDIETLSASALLRRKRFLLQRF